MSVESSNLDRSDDVQLLQRLRAGEGRAYEDLVRQHAPRMLAVAKRYCRVELDAQEAVQDAFTNAFKAIDKFEGNSALGTWLHTITVRSALMKLRTDRRHQKREVTIDDFIPKYDRTGHRIGAAKEGRWADAASVGVEREELRQIVRNAIDQLPEAYRDVLLLRDIEGHDTEKTAEILDVSTANVKTRLHRARQALRELLKGTFDRGQTSDVQVRD